MMCYTYGDNLKEVLVETFDVDLIIFDLDGTLIDSSEDIASAANMVLAELGHQKMDSEKVKEGVGWGVKTLLEKMMPGESAERIEYASIKFLEFYWDHSVVSTYLYPVVMETIEYFKQKNKKLAVVTNKPFSLSEKILSDFDLTRYFDIILGGDSVANKKPHPEPIEKAIT